MYIAFCTRVYNVYSMHIHVMYTYINSSCQDGQAKKLDRRGEGDGMEQSAFWGMKEKIGRRVYTYMYQ